MISNIGGAREMIAARLQLMMVVNDVERVSVLQQSVGCFERRAVIEFNTILTKHNREVCE